MAEQSTSDQGQDLPRIASIGHIAPEVIALVPAHFARRYSVMPLAVVGDGGRRLKAAFSEPFDLPTVDTLGYALGLAFEVVLAPREEIRRAIREHYGPTPDTMLVCDA